MAYHPEKPYNELPSLPPKVDIESKVILKKAIGASRALSELKGAITNLKRYIPFLTVTAVPVA